MEERRTRVSSSCGGWESDLVDGSNLEDRRLSDLSECVCVCVGAD